MMRHRYFPRIRFGRDKTFWLVVGGVFLLYGIMRLGVVGLLSAVAALLVAITVHECAHAWVADQLGDPTARLMGRVSLNPLVHLDPMGSVMMAVTMVMGVGIGWGKPVPVSPHRLRFGQRLGNGIVALAGPVANLLTALVLGLVLRLMPTPFGGLGGVLTTIALSNIVIAMFNLLPLPPLDGHSVLLGLLSLSKSRVAWQVSQFILTLRRQGPMVLIVVIILTQFVGINLIGWLIGPPTRLLFRLIVGA
ncbi:MAG TPA: site-2 protease family protein [Chloroflexi bacterium]|jgi:Zn-dependent protease|nr:site-2 protease family protein [Chloroflexota bacterium]